jgi:hypothetical protein
MKDTGPGIRRWVSNKTNPDRDLDTPDSSLWGLSCTLWDVE